MHYKLTVFYRSEASNLFRPRAKIFCDRATLQTSVWAGEGGMRGGRRGCGGGGRAQHQYFNYFVLNFHE